MQGKRSWHLPSLEGRGEAKSGRGLAGPAVLWRGGKNWSWWNERSTCWEEEATAPSWGSVGERPMCSCQLGEVNLASGMVTRHQLRQPEGKEGFWN